MTNAAHPTASSNLVFSAGMKPKRHNITVLQIIPFQMCANNSFNLLSLSSNHTYVHVSVFSTVTETVHAVGTASLSWQEQRARNQSMLPVKAYPPAQVSAICCSYTRTAASTFWKAACNILNNDQWKMVVGFVMMSQSQVIQLSTFLSHNRQQQSMPTSRKRQGRHCVCRQWPVSERRVQPFLWGCAEPSVLCLQW